MSCFLKHVTISKLLIILGKYNSLQKKLHFYQPVQQDPDDVLTTVHRWRRNTKSRSLKMHFWLSDPDCYPDCNEMSTTDHKPHFFHYGWCIKSKTPYLAIPGSSSGSISKSNQLFLRPRPTSPQKYDSIQKWVDKFLSYPANPQTYKQTEAKT